MQVAGNYQILFNKNFGGNFYCQNNTSQISFTALPKAESLKNAAEEIMNRSIVFGPKEYKKLSDKDFAVLREYRKIFQDADCRNISDMIYISKLFSNGLHRKYLEGFTLVSIGRSPAFLTKYLEFQRGDVKYCPISKLHSKELHVTPSFIKDYKKYLDSIGLTADFVNAAKYPVVFTDFVFNGNTIRNFERFLGLPEIGINNKQKMKFCSISDFTECELMATKSYYDLDYMYQRYRKIFDGDPVKFKYSPIPSIDSRNYGVACPAEKEFAKYYLNGNRFEEKFDTKMMNFILAENAI